MYWKAADRTAVDRYRTSGSQERSQERLRHDNATKLPGGAL